MGDGSLFRLLAPRLFGRGRGEQQRDSCGDTIYGNHAKPWPHFPLHVPLDRIMAKSGIERPRTWPCWANDPLGRPWSRVWSFKPDLCLTCPTTAEACLTILGGRRPSGEAARSLNARPFLMRVAENDRARRRAASGQQYGDGRGCAALCYQSACVATLETRRSHARTPCCQPFCRVQSVLLPYRAPAPVTARQCACLASQTSNRATISGAIERRHSRLTSSSRHANLSSRRAATQFAPSLSRRDMSR